MRIAITVTAVLGALRQSALAEASLNVAMLSSIINLTPERLISFNSLPTRVLVIQALIHAYISS